LSEHRHKSAIPNSKEEEAADELKASPKAVSNDYEALDSLQTGSQPPSPASNQDNADPEVKVDLTSL